MKTLKLIPFQKKAYRGMIPGNEDKTLGEFYTIDRNIAEFYRNYKAQKNGTKGKIIEEIIKFKNPLYINNRPGSDAFEEMTKKIPKLKNILKTMYKITISDQAIDNAIVKGEQLIKDYAESMNYDGIVFDKGETIIKISLLKNIHEN